MVLPDIQANLGGKRIRLGSEQWRIGWRVLLLWAPIDASQRNAGRSARRAALSSKQVKECTLQLNFTLFLFNCILLFVVLGRVGCSSLSVGVSVLDMSIYLIVFFISYSSSGAHFLYSKFNNVGQHNCLKICHSPIFMWRKFLVTIMTKTVIVQCIQVPMPLLLLNFFNDMDSLDFWEWNTC